ncbi:putative deoxyribonucleotide triphosphate pyrophosphatase [hydrothermal vent metagenome]|uniref:Putative deoxyribonucleotide triphosphate pyrophosphatase n=1 Tax=hydrothermal vent metagenome TaxID=652676 RepID=A0A1W1CE95_9ZZZZ
MFLKSIKLVSTIGIVVLCVGCGSTDSKKDNRASQEQPLVEDIAIVTVGSQELTSTQAEVIKLHNEKRRNYYTDSDLSYSMALEKAAQKYANTLASNGKFEHDPENGEKGYGENLYAHSKRVALTTADAMPHWYDEEKVLYNYDDGSCQEAYYDNGSRIKCGHYTQVIWQETREVGCATAQYKTGDMKNGFVYVCKYKKAGNSSMNGKEEKPYCTSYDNSDIYLDTVPSSLALAGKSFAIELRKEDRIACTKVDSLNSAIEFSADLKTAKIENFEMVTFTYNGEPAKNTLEFDTVLIDDKTIKLSGINKNIPAKDYQNNSIYMNLTIIGEATDYYSVEIEWNALDKDEPLYTRRMKAKLYK